VTIKETAGKILLYFYQLQRTVPASMPYRQVVFIDKPDGTVSLTTDKKWLTNDLSDINRKSADVYNAFHFLVNKKFLQVRERSTSGTHIFVAIKVSDVGIDLIEGVETGSEGQQAFTTTFNISAEGATDVDSFIKDNLSMLMD